MPSHVSLDMTAPSLETVAEMQPPVTTCTHPHRLCPGSPAHRFAPSAPPTLKRLKLLDQLLALWIFLAMAVGIIIGQFSDAGEVLEEVKFVQVSLPLGTFRFFRLCTPLYWLRRPTTTLMTPIRAAIALIVMMWPILCRVSPSSLFALFSQRQLYKHLLFSLVINWIVAPLIMLALAWAFLPDKQELREGLILVRPFSFFSFSPY